MAQTVLGSLKKWDKFDIRQSPNTSPRRVEKLLWPVSLRISDKLRTGGEYQLRMTAHNSAGSTRHTYTLLAGATGHAVALQNVYTPV